MNKKCFHSVFALLVLLCFSSTCTCQYIARWVACSPEVPFGSINGNHMQPSPIPQSCLNSCSVNLQSDYAITLSTGETSFGCNCPRSTTFPPTNETEIMAGFLNCNASCTDGGFLQRCGSVGTSYWMWYENSTFNSTAGAITINMCYNLTTRSELTQCREERILSAIFMGRSTNGVYRSIEFVDPCGTNNGGCDSMLADCSFDSESGYRACTCRSGYTPDLSNDMVPGFKCMDVDECAMASTNDCNQTTSVCINTIGNFTCQCRLGFIDQDPLNPGRNCIPVYDECRMRIPNLCTFIATCTNNPTPPGHTCSCPAGYSGDGLINGTGCTDIDECVENTAICGQDTSCLNTVGSFRCACNDGFIMGRNGMCVRAYFVQDCDTMRSTDRLIAYGFNCEVAVLFPCGDTGLGQDRVRIVQNGTGNGPYDNCVNHQLVNNFTRDQLLPADFINTQGISLLQPVTTCTAASLAVTFYRGPLSFSFDLTNLFIGGSGDFNTAQSSYQNDMECQGQTWVENGLKYRFEIGANSTNCGITRTVVNDEVVYTGVIRGRSGTADSGPVTRATHFYLSFSCAYPINNEVSNEQPVLFYDLGRKKRAAEVKEEFDFPGAPDLTLTMSLRKDGNSGEVKQLPLLRSAGQRVDVQASLTGISDQRYGVKVLRCWESLQKTGDGYPFKNIISNSCDKSEMDDKIYLDKSNNQYNYKFAFDVQSIYGGTEDVYVSCLFDVLSPGQTCRPLVATSETLHIDPYMLVRTVGPIRVHSVCGGKNRGGCEHFCSETTDNKAFCHCAKGFIINPKEPRRCILPQGESEESNFDFLFYVIPVTVLIAIIFLVIIVMCLREYCSKRKGMYELKQEEIKPEQLIDSSS